MKRLLSRKAVVIYAVQQRCPVQQRSYSLLGERYWAFHSLAPADMEQSVEVEAGVFAAVVFDPQDHAPLQRQHGPKRNGITCSEQH